MIFDRLVDLYFLIYLIKNVNPVNEIFNLKHQFRYEDFSYLIVQKIKLLLTFKKMELC